jgi:hypothetical protein
VLLASRFVAEDYLDFGFAIVGVQKAGTSTLSQALNWHPHVCRAPRKEMRFFVREDVDWADPPYDEYRAPRSKPQQRIAGDASPLYLWWPHALERMRRYNPDMRLVAIFRDPIERAFSHWLMMRGRNPRRRPDWPVLVRDHLPDGLPAELPEEVGPRELRDEWSAFSRGLYAAQLERGLAAYRRDQWLLLEFRSMVADLPAAVHRVTDHIGIRPFREVPPLRPAMAAPESVPGTPPTAAEIATLADVYAADLARFADLSGLDISAWPTRRILDGDLDPGELAARFGAKVEPVS